MDNKVFQMSFNKLNDPDGWKGLTNGQYAFLFKK